MESNLFVSYDLYKPEQNYEAVGNAIKQLGAWAKVQKSFWYVRSSLTAQEAATRIWQVMDSNDTLMVINSSDDTAYWYNLTPEVAKFLQEQWYQARRMG